MNAKLWLLIAALTLVAAVGAWNKVDTATKPLPGGVLFR